MQSQERMARRVRGQHLRGTNYGPLVDIAAPSESVPVISYAPDKITGTIQNGALVVVFENEDEGSFSVQGMSFPFQVGEETPWEEEFFFLMSIYDEWTMQFSGSSITGSGGFIIDNHHR